MVNGGEVDTKFLVLVSSVFLFLIFLVIQPGNPTGLVSLPVIGEIGDLSSPGVIIAIVVLVAIWVAVLFLYIQLKKKKQLENLPNLPEMNQNNPVPMKQEQGNKLSEEELNQLFKEVNPPNEVIQKSELKKFEINQVTKETTKQDLTELKKLMLSLLNKNYKKESIILYLQKKGWKTFQIAQTLREINQENLRNYFKEAMSFGYSKEKIKKQLLAKGWTLEDISKF